MSKKKFSINDILHVDKKVYKPKAQYKHPLMYALKNMCDKIDMREAYKSGKLTASEADLIVIRFKRYKESLPSKNRRTTAAQVDVMEALKKFANLHRFS